MRYTVIFARATGDLFMESFEAPTPEAAAEAAVARLRSLGEEPEITDAIVIEGDHHNTLPISRPQVVAEVFFVDRSDAAEMFAEQIAEDVADHVTRAQAISARVGWYWRPCFPGCLPDGDPVGPFDTQAEALKDARRGERGQMPARLVLVACPMGTARDRSLRRATL